MSCEYCDPISKELVHEGGMYMSLDYLPSTGWLLEAEAHTTGMFGRDAPDADATVAINYCPMCGRRLDPRSGSRTYRA